MPAQTRYTTGRPERYTKRVPIFWWVKKWSFVRFILRELSAVSVASFAVVLVILVRCVSLGPDAYAGFLAALRSPVSIALFVIAALFVVFHSITWFNLAPKAMVIKLGKRRVPPALILGMNYAAWIVVSAVILWIFSKA